jgi:FHA domain/von Willebrand factor type A domain
VGIQNRYTRIPGKEKIMSGNSVKRIPYRVMVAVVTIFLIFLPTWSHPATAQQEVYNTPFLTDQELEDYTSLTADQIRSFLTGYNSYFSQPVADVDGVIFDAAEVIAQAATQYHINPKVILATLEKESSGVTNSGRPNDKRMMALMGCLSASTAREQLVCAAERFRSYQDQLTSKGQSPSGWKVGVAKLTQDGVSVTPATKAVAGQFTYTPYAGVQWGGNVSGKGGVYLFYAVWNKFNFGSTINPPQPTPIIATNTATALVMDVSGSMADIWQGGVKIDSAKAAANQIINMLSQEDQVTNSPNHVIGIVSFTDDASRLLDLTADYNQARSVIGSLTPLNSTNLGAGITGGNQILAQAAPGSSRILILLSDGLSNSGLSADQILAGPVQDAVQAGTCIYTIGFGDANNLDEDLLRRIAAASGCGQYYYATDVIELEQVYVRIRHQSTGNILAQFGGQVAQGQTVQAGSVDVPPGQGELAISLLWPGSKMQLILRDPNGAVLSPNAPNVRINTFGNLVYALVTNPVPGTWLVEVFGEEILQAAENFDVLVSARPAPVTPIVSTSTPIPLPALQTKGGGFPVLLIFVLLGGGGVGLYVYATILKRRRAPQHASAEGSWNTGSGASLVILNGPRAGQAVSLRSPSIRIGRSSTNQVQLPDPGVSRSHVTLRQSEGNWFLQDLNSKAGTFVNGQRISKKQLSHGDRLLVGSTEMIFRMQ